MHMLVLYDEITRKTKLFVTVDGAPDRCWTVDGQVLIGEHGTMKLFFTSMGQVICMS